MNIRAEIEFGRQNAVSPPVPRQERHLAPLQCAANVSVRRCAKRRIHPHFLHLAQAPHGIEPAAADNPNLRLCHSPSKVRVYSNLRRGAVKPVIIQERS
jgi:hypothetical protein